jgi:hypothetical protein
MYDMPLAHIALAVESGTWNSEHAFPLMVMQQLIGTWDRTGGAGANQASKLTQTVAEHELAHSVASFNTCYKDTGLFGVYAVCEPHKVQDLMWYTLESMVRLCHDVTDEEVQRAKGQLKANLMMSLDGSANTCEGTCLSFSLSVSLFVQKRKKFHLTLHPFFSSFLLLVLLLSPSSCSSLSSSFLSPSTRHWTTNVDLRTSSDTG